MCNLKLLENPIFFEQNRVWRCYTGGKLLDKFLGKTTNCTDNNFPEEWLASNTIACNEDKQQAPDEGLSKIKNSSIPFVELLKSNPQAALGTQNNTTTNILCKFLDSAIRLPIQCHPDKEFAKKYCNSNYGKTESWLILKTRTINGEEPYILLGFKPNIDKKQFYKATKKQDINAMTNCLHKFPVKPGDVYFIPGRIPHAIGPGILLLEVQEPTDLVVQPEQHIGKVKLTQKQMWGDLDFETAMSCFNYQGSTTKQILQKLKLEPETIKKDPSAIWETIINPKHTNCFSIDKLTINKNLDFLCDNSWHLGIVTKGSGTITAKDEIKIKQGDCFFISNQIKNLTYNSENNKESLQIYLVFNQNKL